MYNVTNFLKVSGIMFSSTLMNVGDNLPNCFNNFCFKKLHSEKLRMLKNCFCFLTPQRVNELSSETLTF